jgi:hypothetical protein
VKLSLKKNGHQIIHSTWPTQDWKIVIGSVVDSWKMPGNYHYPSLSRMIPLELSRGLLFLSSSKKFILFILFYFW